VKLKKAATEIFNLLCEAYGENTLSRAHVFEWHKRFSEGRENAEEYKRPCHLLMMITNENVGKVRTLVRIYHCLGIRMIAEELNMGKETVRQILTTNLNMKKSVGQSGPKESASF
jgi:hypothetical protein